MSEAQVEQIPPTQVKQGAPTSAIFTETARRSATTDIAIEKAKAEVVAKVLSAQQIGRDIKACEREMEQFCDDPDFADEAVYTISRGKKIQGPSIRFAEQLAWCWGHLISGYEEHSHDDGRSVIEASCWDQVKNNTTYERVVVEHKFQGGREVPEHDTAGVYQVVASQAAKNRRNVILQQIPIHIRNRLFQRCLETNRKVENLPASMANAQKQWLAQFKVTKEQIEEFIGKPIEKATLDDYNDLRGAWQAIKQGMAKVEDYFLSKEAKQKLAAADKDVQNLAAAGQAAQQRAAENAVAKAEAAKAGNAGNAPSNTAKPPSQQTQGQAGSVPTKTSPPERPAQPPALPPGKSADSTGQPTAANAVPTNGDTQAASASTADPNKKVAVTDISAAAAKVKAKGWDTGSMKAAVGVSLTELTVGQLEKLTAFCLNNAPGTEYTP